MTPLPIADAVALALAPIFLLAGIGAILNVMTQRLGRVVDRARIIEDFLDEGESEERRARHRTELKYLDVRISAANRAIFATSLAALLICFVVALLFLEELFSFRVGTIIAALFIITMVSLTVGLVFFLVEIFVANRSLKIRPDLLG
ncbi:MAG: DUF2721 domain-containing protein [Pseudomonadota bacterium]